ncbi:MAG: PQQ-binding-like beta-propeller repeat protein [Proteobacteria bacterium]|nr:PQQ-binding-like beta-propeller repeat protein [Pseudomonadota bacterium]MCP4921105.1 PQQ-binding-like beta-propeller repeat protein [Pseudomonadota bacterium]
MLLLTLACARSPLELAWEEGLDISEVALVDGVIYATDGPMLLGIDVASGGTMWSTEMPDAAGGMPVVTGADEVVTWAEAGVFVYDLDGLMLWSLSADMVVQEPPAVGADDTLYLVGLTLAQDQALLTALTSDGVAWQTPFEAGRPIGQPAVGADGTIYVVLTDGTGGLLAAVDDDGNRLWQTLLDGASANTEVIPHQGLHVLEAGVITELDPATGEVLGTSEGVGLTFDGAVSVRSGDGLVVTGREDEAEEFLEYTCNRTVLGDDGAAYTACVLPDDPGRTLVFDAKGKARVGDVADFAAVTTLPAPLVWDGTLVYQLDAGLVAYSGAASDVATGWPRRRADQRNTNRAK